jgi:hypothetical protein
MAAPETPNKSGCGYFFIAYLNKRSKSTKFYLDAFNTLDEFIYTIGMSMAKDFNSSLDKKVPLPIAIDRAINSTVLGKIFVAEYLSKIFTYYKDNDRNVFTHTGNLITAYYKLNDSINNYPNLIFGYTLQVIFETLIDGCLEAIKRRDGRRGIDGEYIDKNIIFYDIERAPLITPGFSNLVVRSMEEAIKQIPKNRGSDILVDMEVFGANNYVLPNDPYRSNNDQFGLASVSSKSPPKARSRSKSPTRVPRKTMGAGQYERIRSMGSQNGSRSGSPSSRRSKSPKEDLNKKTVKELKDMLRGRGLPVSGKKADLIKRLS